MPRARAFTLLLFSVLFVTYTESQLPREPLSQNSNQTRTAAAHLFQSVPISFEANQGQADHEVRYLSRGAGYSLFLSPDGAELAVRESATLQPQEQEATLVQPHGGPASVRHITIRLIGANPNA